jgi:hypothetical protein
VGSSRRRGNDKDKEEDKDKDESEEIEIDDSDSDSDSESDDDEDDGREEEEHCAVREEGRLPGSWEVLRPVVPGTVQTPPLCLSQGTKRKAVTPRVDSVAK